jgi:tetrahydromethanopterin S-methyltransferase subunit G
MLRRRRSSVSKLAPKISLQRATCAHLSVYDGATMAVAMKDSWTDDRLDDFRGDVNRRFDEVDKRFDKVDGEMNRRFDGVDRRFDKVDSEMNRRFDEVDGEFKRLDSKMDGLQRTMMLTGGGIIAALIGVIGTQI